MSKLILPNGGLVKPETPPQGVLSLPPDLTDRIFGFLLMLDASRQIYTEYAAKGHERTDDALDFLIEGTAHAGELMQALLGANYNLKSAQSRVRALDTLERRRDAKAQAADAEAQADAG